MTHTYFTENKNNVMSGLNSRSLFLIIIGDISRNIVQYEKQCDDTDDGRVEFKKIVTSFVVILILS